MCCCHHEYVLEVRAGWSDFLLVWPKPPNGSFGIRRQTIERTENRYVSWQDMTTADAIRPNERLILELRHFPPLRLVLCSFSFGKRAGHV